MKRINKTIILALGVLMVSCTQSNISSSSSSNSSYETSSSASENSSSLNNESSSDEKVSSSTQDEQLTSSSSSSIVSEEIDSKFVKHEVYSEGMYAIFNENNVSKATVEYKLSTDTAYKTLDKELIRKETDETVRFDILGLKAGLYDIKVTTSTSEVLEMKNIKVTSYDRSGYAHFGVTKGVGAYNNDGTLKENADVIYVSDENKNTIEYNGQKGLVNIIQNLKNKVVAIRLLGRISTRSFDQDSKTYTRDDALGITDLNNLTNKDNGDNSYWNMCNINSTGGFTLEGVGDDAEIFQWGFTISKSKYVEIRNISFTDYPEDACAVAGDDKDITAAQYIWIHNNVFNTGKNYVDQTTEQDKPNGDGATDIKTCSNVTIAYNIYNKCHKTGLIGGSDSQKSNKITFHHNYYNQCKSRLPLGRQAVMHMYNNYYYKISSSSLSIRGNGYAFVENCYFDKGQNPLTASNGGAIKSYNNIITASGTNNSVTVTSRDQTISNSNSFHKTFDTDPSYFYYDAENKVTKVENMLSPEDVQIKIPLIAGINKANFVSSSYTGEVEKPTSSISSSEQEVSSSVIQGDVVLFNAANFSEGTHTSSLSKNGFTIHANSEKSIKIEAKDDFKSFSSSYTKVVNLGGAGTDSYRSIQFELQKDATIYIYAKSNSSSEARQIRIFGDEEHTFDGIVGASELTKTLSAGTYYVASKNSGMSIAAIKIVY